jgi:hypothetical protein
MDSEEWWAVEALLAREFWDLDRQTILETLCLLLSLANDELNIVAAGPIESVLASDLNTYLVRELIRRRPEQLQRALRWVYPDEIAPSCRPLIEKLLGTG